MRWWTIYIRSGRQIALIMSSNPESNIISGTDFLPHNNLITNLIIKPIACINLLLKKDRILLHLPLLPPLSEHRILVSVNKLSVALPRRINNIFDCLLLNLSIDLSHFPWLAPFFNKWSIITKDSWALAIICFGYLLEFSDLPLVGRLKITTYLL